MELVGEWRAAPADDELRRAFPEPDMDDRSWIPVRVPSSWRQHPALAAQPGPVLYRHRFEHPPPDEGRRVWLVFDGVFYQSDVWLDGAYLGDTEGYFVPHAFEVTHLLGDRPSHLLGVEVACSGARGRNLTGLVQEADANPGGIWRPVRLVSTGPVRIERLRVLCTDANEERAVLVLRAVLDTREPRRVRLRTCVRQNGGVVGHDSEQHLAVGANRVEWRVRVERPALWWPRALGEPELVEVDLSVEEVAGDAGGPEGGRPDGGGPGSVSDARTIRTGLREVRQRSFQFEVNGRRLFLKGAIAEPMASPAAVDRAVALGLDLLRLRAHVSTPEVYDAADRAGLLLWQDLPLHGPYARTVRKQAARQAREAVDLLGHHPSIVHWTGHDEPVTEQRPLRRFTAMALPTWNKTVLDLSVHRALSRSDPSRPITAHSDVAPGPFSPGTDTHLRGDDVAGPLARFPRRARFVSAFGDAAGPPDALRRQIEHLRLLKYQPAGGFAFSSLDDLPVASEAVVAAALAPTVVVAGDFPASVRPGDTYAVDVHVAHDGRDPIESADVGAVLRWPGGSRSWAWRGAVPADGCVRVGTLSIVVPAPDPAAVTDAAPVLALSLHLVGSGGERAGNGYTARYAAGDTA